MANPLKYLVQGFYYARTKLHNSLVSELYCGKTNLLENLASEFYCAWTNLRKSSAPEYPMGYALCRRLPALAHCFKMVDAWHFCKQVLDVWCPNLLFGMLGDSSMASWGTLVRFWDTGEHKNGNFEVQAWTNKCVICYACFQVCFSDNCWV